jgi:hypothetical protein
LGLKAVYNPELEDFEWEYLDEHNHAQVARIHAMEVELLPAWLADLVTTHLVDFVYNKRGQKENPEKDKAEIRKEIETIKVYDHP